MHGPPLVGWLLVVLCAATGAYCLRRARAGGAGERRAARGDALMGLGMAVMALPVPATTARPWSAALFTVVFGAAGLRALVPSRSHGGTRHLHHAIGAFAMVYMALAMPGASAGGHGEHGGHTGSGHLPAGVPLLTGALLAYFAVYVVRTAVGILAVPAAARGAAAWSLGPEPRARPELTRACRLSMGIGMLAMLLSF